MFWPNTCTAISGACKVASLGVKLITIAGIHATFLATFLFQRCTVCLVSGEGCCTLLITLRHRSNKKLTGSTSLKAVKQILTIYRKTDQLSTSNNFFYNTYVVEITCQENFLNRFYSYSIISGIFLNNYERVFLLQDKTSWEVPQRSLHMESNSIGNSVYLITDSIMLMILQVNNR